MTKQKVLIIGSGGREHALAWRLAQSPDVRPIYAAPGNPGIASLAECRPAVSIEDYLALAEAEKIDLTVVGPEAPLVAGIVDRFRDAGHLIFGPTAAAAQLEGSKSFSKDFMTRNGIPTARYSTVTALENARRAMDEIGFPLVLKADGLAAGKGVVIAQDRNEAEAALPHLLGDRLVIEEFLAGEEVSFIVLSDGRNTLPLQPTQDHKAVFDGDKGPNTGGMGAYCDPDILTDEQTARILTEVIEPTIAGIASEGTPFTGFLYAGLMMTTAGPKVLEFNARLGDPETQALMHRMGSDFFPALDAAARGNLAGMKLQWKLGPSVCVVLASHGYPGDVRTGDKITGIQAAEQTGSVVFQAGTKRRNGDLITSGGRVLGVTAAGNDLRSAIEKTYASLKHVHFDGLHYRSDIGAKGLKRNKPRYPEI